LRKAASLIKLLALAPSHCLHGERVMDLLWPESGKKAASNNLRQTLHVARKTLHPDPQINSRYLTLGGEQLLLCPYGGLWVDVEAFEQAADTARRSKNPSGHQAAIELYSGELLPEERYEEWAQSRRRELKQTFLSLLIELAGLYEERGTEEDLALAVRSLQRTLAEEPTNEEVHVALMRVYAEARRSPEAVREAFGSALRRAGCRAECLHARLQGGDSGRKVPGRSYPGRRSPYRAIRPAEGRDLRRSAGAQSARPENQFRRPRTGDARGQARAGDDPIVDAHRVRGDWQDPPSPGGC
jgi:DNA-binding SARP family transcriptional activator